MTEKNIIQTNGKRDYKCVKKDYVRDLPACSCKNEKHLTSIMDDLGITCEP